VQHFTGKPYDVNDEGSRIAGSVCGVNVDYSVARNDNGHIVLNGFLGTGRPMYVEVEPTPTGQRITGTLSGATGRGEIDLFVDGNTIKGRAGQRSFDLKADGDIFSGPMTALNTVGWVPAIVAGRNELARMPSADMAAILPPLLNCAAPIGRAGAVRSAMLVGIGGTPGYDTHQANELR
ncbi:MAG TPA: hypothetical protein VIA18_26615, partial [Polyangia bacterium]|nr:hypothetical protein [Polyangia bacterium]